MRNEILAIKQVGIPIGFEVWIAAATVWVKLVFIAIYQLQLWVAIEFDYSEIERSRSEFVVMIEKSNKVAANEFESGIGRARDVHRRGQAPRLYSRIVAKDSRDQRPNMGCG